MTDFWSAHGIVFLTFLIAFPRLTMLFATAVPFGVLAWMAWLFVPSLLVAILATNYYWQTNPILCVGAWLWFAAKVGGSGKAARRKD
jgi:hypothetical protein